MKTHYLLYTLAFLLLVTTSKAQVAQEMPAPPFIKTVQFSAGGSRQAQLPIIRLGAGIEVLMILLVMKPIIFTKSRITTPIGPLLTSLDQSLWTAWIMCEF